VGDGPLLDRIRTAAEGAGLHGRVRLHGRMTYDQALAVVARADIFAFPSYIETYGASLLEAMALGIPSVATGITAIRTHLIDNGQNGLTVPIRDATALKLALARLMGDARLRQQVGEAGRKKVAGLTYQAYLNATLAFYRQILA
jgi:glycosyltransferase involved in cell wall biosynthesis